QNLGLVKRAVTATIAKQLQFAPAQIPDDGVAGLMSDDQNGTTMTFRQKSGPTPYYYTGAIVTTAPST
ncbi:MAG: hypothetical protein AAFU67_14315, partial [Bacteroidota bacterium]